MKTRILMSMSLSALVLGGSVVGCTATGGHVASASDRVPGASFKDAAKSAALATKALGKRDAIGAIGFAETAVQRAPRDAGYRYLLGQSYLQAGRFQSARASFADVLELTPNNGKAALNLALAEIATGDWAAARKTLDANATIIPVGDLGLALALAGNPAGAVAMLTTVARSPQADAKVRQNLALALALSGQWQGARLVAAADMSLADVDARMQEWAAFAQPKGASDQVATLLGVTAMPDQGQPVALALNAPVQVAAVASAPVSAPVEAPAPIAVAAVPVAAPVAAPTPVQIAAPIAAPSPAFAKIVFAPARAVVQPLPTPLLRAEGPTKISLATFRAAEAAPRAATAGSGDWFVQIGAFQNAGVAKDGWSRATRRFAGLSGHQPTGTRFSTKDGAFYRLSVGGFDRPEADRMCRSYRAKGGACFVRRAAGDQMAQWLKKPVQLASR